MEFFDNPSFLNKFVVSVMVPATNDDRYTANAFVDVRINKEGAYDLMGDFRIRILDSVGKFTIIDGNTKYRRSNVDLNLSEWRDFVDHGANIDSIRRVRPTNQSRIIQHSEGQ